MKVWDLYTELQKMVDDPEIDSDLEVVFMQQNGRTIPVGDIENDGYRVSLIED